MQPAFYVSVKPLLAGWDMVLRRGASAADPAVLHITKPARVFKDKNTEVIIKVRILACIRFEGMHGHDMHV